MEIICCFGRIMPKYSVQFQEVVNPNHGLPVILIHFWQQKRRFVAKGPSINDVTQRFFEA